jgi:hypothetical protein
VQVGGRAACVAGVPDVAEHVARPDDVSFAEVREPIEMRVIVPLQTWADDADNQPAEPIGSDTRDDSARGADHRSALGCENVDPFVSAAAGARRAPRVRHPSCPYRSHGIRQARRRVLRRQRHDEPCPFGGWPKSHNRRGDRDSGKKDQECSFHRLQFAPYLTDQNQASRVQLRATDVQNITWKDALRDL